VDEALLQRTHLGRLSSIMDTKLDHQAASLTIL
jgi:hypothetical protein